MGLRERTRRTRKLKQRRCPKCGCLLNKQRKRCKKCHHVPRTLVLGVGKRSI
jgi:hypothetical protein